MFAQREDPYVLAANLRTLIGAADDDASIAASYAVAEVISLYRKLNAKG